MKTSRTYRAAFETLESRDLLAGDIILNSATGIISVIGTTSHDTVQIDYLDRGTANAYDDKVRITMRHDGHDHVRSFFLWRSTATWTWEPAVTRIGFNGDAGNDTLNNNSSLRIDAFGGSGDDRLVGGTTGDRLYGQDGNDQLIGGGGNDSLYGESGSDQLWGTAGDDLLEGGSMNDLLYGESGNDVMRGQAGSDLLVGGSGNDVLEGGNGSDSLHGENGLDQLTGGAGADYLDGGYDTSADVLTGGLGVDQFVQHYNASFRAEDVLSDFNPTWEGDSILARYH